MSKIPHGSETIKSLTEDWPPEEIDQAHVFWPNDYLTNRELRDCLNWCAENWNGGDRCLDNEPLEHLVHVWRRKEQYF